MSNHTSNRLHYVLLSFILEPKTTVSKHSQFCNAGDSHKANLAHQTNIELQPWDLQIIEYVCTADDIYVPIKIIALRIDKYILLTVFKVQHLL